MPLQNRVTPLSELIADSARGLVYGNRGCLHDANRQIRRLYAVRRWISCRLRFRNWHRSPLMRVGQFTELFFLDEVTAFSAGHRPCALCRRDDYDRFKAFWRDLHCVDEGADAIDLRLHNERLATPRARRLHEVPFTSLPDGVFVLQSGVPCLVRAAELLLWTPAGYTHRLRRPSAGIAQAITPPSLIELLARDWSGSVPLFHGSAE